MPYSIPISLMFTFIEAGVGIMFGFMDRNRDENVANNSKYISLTLGWIIILLLAGIELVLYFLVGCLYNETYDGDLEALVEEAMSGNIIEPFLNGGFLSFLGPIIVFALYLFGHQVSVAYFKYSRRTDLDRFKDDLDSKFKMYEAIKSGMSSASEGIKDILGKIKDRNEAKKVGNYKLADQIRDELIKEGIDIKDEKGKTTWNYKWAKIKYIFLILH